MKKKSQIWVSKVMLAAFFIGVLLEVPALVTLVSVLMWGLMIVLIGAALCGLGITWCLRSNGVRPSEYWVDAPHLKLNWKHYLFSGVWVCAFLYTNQPYLAAAVIVGVGLTYLWNKMLTSPLTSK